ncbi:MAG: hypothetical protein JG767_1307 [Deferribacteraceae bacterium]|jgi:hypothetical protein|nr:hypothetical protein [Deferribacteraceae bacterium]
MTELNIEGYHLKPFTIKEKQLMESYLKYITTDIDVSDYSFAANFIWLSGATGFYSIVNDTFCLFNLNGGELSMLLPPIGKLENVNDAMLTCFEIMNTNNTSLSYSKIEYVSTYFVQSFIEYSEDADIFQALDNYIIEKKNIDYVYLADDLINLKGNSYATKRNEINKFRKNYPNISIETLNPESHYNGIMELTNSWIVNRMKYLPNVDMDTFIDGINWERAAIKRTLNYYNKLDIIGVVLKFGEKIVGFTVGERLNDKTASVIIEKTDFFTLGAAQYIFWEFSKILKSTYDIVYVNVGDDMGLENLKKVKMSYRPHTLLPKYTIYQKL